MLPGLRFIIGAALGSLALIVTALGLAATVRIAHEAKVGPLEPSRTLAFADPADWHPFYDTDRGRRFERGAPRQAAAGDGPLREAVPAAPARSAKPIDEREEHTATIPSTRYTSGDDKVVLFAPEPSEVAPSEAPAPPTELVPRAAEERTLTKIATAVAATETVPAAIAPKEPERTIAEPAAPVVGPSERLANLSSPTEGTDVAAKPLAAPKAKRAAKARKKVARRRARVPASQPFANNGFPAPTSPNKNESWWFPN
jgi:hypothetical protein